MAKIKYITGDITSPVPSNKHIYILQICNDIGAYGAGVSGAIAKKWPKVEKCYRNWHRDSRSFNNKLYFKLGEIQIIYVEPKIAVINMIAQHLVGTDENGGPCIRYPALNKCLNKIANIAAENGAEIHAPRIGIGLAGGLWSKIEPMLMDSFIQYGINVTIYDLPNADFKSKLEDARNKIIQQLEPQFKALENASKISAKDLSITILPKERI